MNANTVQAIEILAPIALSAMQQLIGLVERAKNGTEMSDAELDSFKARSDEAHRVIQSFKPAESSSSTTG